MVPVLKLSHRALPMHYRWDRTKYLSLEQNAAARTAWCRSLKRLEKGKSALPDAAEGIKEVELFYLMVQCKWVRFSMPIE